MIEVIEKIGNIENLSLKNEEMEVVVSTFGCTIIKMIVEDKNGVKGDVVLGYDGENVYIVTAYYPNTDKFEADLKTRKEQ